MQTPPRKAQMALKPRTFLTEPLLLSAESPAEYDCKKNDRKVAVRSAPPLR